MKSTDKISEHFTVEEVISSPTAEKYNINNEPSVAQWVRIKSLIINVLEPARVALGQPFKVNSIFRSTKLNERVKGAGTSQHLANNGAAADIECPELGNDVLFEYLFNHANFDQLI
jgi:zinc D-Ala-D-Ala carboxypeptidase